MKSTIISIIIIIIFSTAIYSQPEIKKKTKYLNNTKEIFYVLKSNKKIKHGPYKKYYNENLIEEGTYKGGIKQIFTFYNENNMPTIKYAFFNDSLIELNINKNECFAFLDYSLFEKVSVDRPAIPIISETEFHLFIAYNVEYPNAAKENGIQGVVEIGFEIDSSGNICNYKLVLGVHPLLNDASMKVIKSFPPDWKWLPAIKDGVAVKSYIAIPVTFKLH